MKTQFFFTILMFVAISAVRGQNAAGIGTENPNPNAVLELVSPTADQGLLVPRLSGSERTAQDFVDRLSEDDRALLVFDLDENTFYFWDGSSWKQVGNALLPGKGIRISDTGAILNEGDLDSLNEIQDLALDGSELVITNNPNATPIDLSVFLDNTDQQTAAEVRVTAQNGVDATDVQSALEELQGKIPLTTSALVNDAGFITLPDDADADPQNEIQDLLLTGSSLTITGNPTASVIDLSSFTGTNTDNQLLDLQGTLLSISGGNEVELAPLIPADISELTDNTSLLFSRSYNDLTDTPVFEGWDTDASDDFSGDYNDLDNRPVIPDFTGWDQDASDDFSGSYNDLTNKPNINGLQNAVNALEAEKTDYFLIPGGEFASVPDSKGSGQSELSLVYDLNGASVILKSLEGSFISQLSSPLRLPNGAAVKSFTVRMKATPEHPSNLVLYRLSLVDGTSTNMASATLSPGQGMTNLTTTKEVLIDNEHFLYYFLFEGGAVPNISYAASLIYVQVEYTYLLNGGGKK